MQQQWPPPPSLHFQDQKQQSVIRTHIPGIWRIGSSLGFLGGLVVKNLPAKQELQACLVSFEIIYHHNANLIFLFASCLPVPKEYVSHSLIKAEISSCCVHHDSQNPEQCWVHRGIETDKEHPNENKQRLLIQSLLERWSQFSSVHFSHSVVSDSL